MLEIDIRHVAVVDHRCFERRQLDGDALEIAGAAKRYPIPYALEIDRPVGVAGFEPLHLRIRIREDSPLGAGALERAHLVVPHLIPKESLRP